MKQGIADRNRPGRSLRIGGRLLILLALPLAGLLAVTGFGVYSGARQSDEAASLSARTELATTAFELANELQLQRSTLVNGGEVKAGSSERVARASSLISANLGALDAPTRRTARTTLMRVAGASSVASSELGGEAAVASLSPAINSVLDLATAAIDPGGSVDPAWASTADNLARAQAASAEEADRLVVLSGAESITATQFQVLVGLASSQRSLLDLAATSSPYEMAVRINRVGHGVEAADETRQAAFEDFGSAAVDTWIDGVTSRTEDIRQIHAEATTSAVRTVDNLAESSRKLLVLAAAAALLTLMVTVLLLRRAIRTIAKPLEQLASEAEVVARVRLPEAVQAQQNDPDSLKELPALEAKGAAEVHEVAAAFNDVQNTALRLASEQAALRLNQAEALTNLGRRNQTLLVRQLDYISSLETEETDPEFLEHLFKLDHLASRMRRNAESLLILAGSETPRRRRSPAQVTEVVRAAMSEVEDFERVRIGHLLDATLTGPVVIDLIHLLAELIENALGFSSPETTVEIDGGPLGQGGYQFAVIDHGVGMTDVELTAANHRLAGLDEFDGMPTRYLGQYVVAKLAAKIGVLVRLNPTNSGRGVSAIVTLPASAMFSSPNRSDVRAPRPGSRAAREQGPEPFAPGSAVPHVATPDQHAVEVPDLRDSHPVSRPADSVPELAGDIVEPVAGAEPEAGESANGELRPVSGEQVPAPIEATATDDPHPERWDRVVDSVLGGVVDLSNMESGGGSEPEPEVTPGELAEVFGQSESTEPASWWVSPEPPPESPQPESVDDSTDAATESGPMTPPVFKAENLAPFQEWHVDPAAQSESSEPVDPAPSAAGEAQTAHEVVGGTTGSGLLRRRVPGASLAARSSTFDNAPAKPAERTAEDVRSRLASFQAGRNRGRATPDASTEPVDQFSSGTTGAGRPTDEANLTEIAGGQGASNDELTSGPDAPQDWRFSK